MEVVVFVAAAVAIVAMIGDSNDEVRAKSRRFFVSLRDADD